MAKEGSSTEEERDEGESDRETPPFGSGALLARSHNHQTQGIDRITNLKPLHSCGPTF